MVGRLIGRAACTRWNATSVGSRGAP